MRLKLISVRPAVVKEMTAGQSAQRYSEFDFEAFLQRHHYRHLLLRLSSALNMHKGYIQVAPLVRKLFIVLVSHI
jgi:uncharacterized protein YueI